MRWRLFRKSTESLIISGAVHSGPFIDCESWWCIMQIEKRLPQKYMIVQGDKFVKFNYWEIIWLIKHSIIQAEKTSN